MKRTKTIAMFSIAAMMIALSISCASKEPAAETQPKEPAVEKTIPTAKAKHVERELIDWKGASIGQDVPAWVYDAVDDNKNALEKIDALQGKVIFIYEGRGKNLNLLKSWINNFDAQAGFARSIKNTVISSFGGVQQGSINDEESDAYLEELVGTFSKAKITGLAKQMDYWVETRIIDNDAKTSEDIYQYFVVYAMEKEDYRFLIDQALGKVDAKTEKEKELKQEVENIALAAAVYDLMDEEGKDQSEDEPIEVGGEY